MPPNVLTSRARSRNTLPPQGPWYPNLGSWQSQGLVAWYPLGDGPAFMRDYAPHPTGPFHLTVAGGFGRKPTPFGGWGYANTGVGLRYLEGTNPVSAAPLTVCGRAMTTTTATFANLINIGEITAGANYFNVSINDTTAGCIEAGTGVPLTGEVDARTAAVITANVWFDFVAVWTSAVRRDIYFNYGTPTGATASNTTSAAPTGITNINVGAYHVGGTAFGPLNGAIADVRVYNYAWLPWQVEAFTNPGTRFDLFYTPSRVAYSFAAAGAPPDSLPWLVPTRVEYEYLDSF